MATEKRLIDANDAFEKVIDLAGQAETKSAYAAFWKAGKAIQQIPTVDAAEVVHSRFVNVADFGDDQGCFGYCERCGTIHHAQHPVALKADYRWCRWCGAKMDGDGNG